jgi:hypothetical protein
LPLVEVTMRRLLKPPRRSWTTLDDSLAGDYADAFCWALDAMEARAEKVRAAFTRTAGRDFYDLGLLVRKGVDLNSAPFLALVDEMWACSEIRGDSVKTA